MLQGVRRTFGRDITNATAGAGAGGKGGVGSEPAAKKSATAATSFFAAPLASLASMAAAPLAAVAQPLASAAAAASTETAAGDEMDYSEPVPYMMRPVDDIDSRDSGNPLLCTAYVNEMYAIFFDQERDMQVANTQNYMPNQQHINEKMRAILVDWMVEVHLKFKMVPETLYLTINLIDRYLQRKTVRRSKLQLVGVACLMVRPHVARCHPPSPPPSLASPLLSFAASDPLPNPHSHSSWPPSTRRSTRPSCATWSTSLTVRTPSRRLWRWRMRWCARSSGT